MLDKTTIGKNIAAARATVGIKSQNALADLMEGYSRSQISQYESGNNLPPLDFLTQFFVLTQTSFEEIILGMPKRSLIENTDEGGAKLGSTESTYALLDQLLMVQDANAKEVLMQKIKTLIGMDREENAALYRKYIALLEKHEDFVTFVKKELKIRS